MRRRILLLLLLLMLMMLLLLNLLLLLLGVCLSLSLSLCLCLSHCLRLSLSLSLSLCLCLCRLYVVCLLWALYRIVWWCCYGRHALLIWTRRLSKGARRRGLPLHARLGRAQRGGRLRRVAAVIREWRLGCKDWAALCVRGPILRMLGLSRGWSRCVLVAVGMGRAA